ncbi:MAG: STN domain-containing protein, partial [Steroidobacteraceae bacterium]
MLLLLCTWQASASETEKFRFDVQPGTADVVLKTLAKQADRQILFPLEQLKSVRANGVHGELLLREALDRALEGTTLKARILASGGITVSFASGQDATGGDGKMKTTPWRELKALAAALAIPLSAIAQTEPATNPASTEVQTVVVTGTLIRQNTENSQLVTNIDAQEIQMRGATDATDILSAVSQNQLSSTPNDGARVGSLTTLANLRSLG